MINDLIYHMMHDMWYGYDIPHDIYEIKGV